MIYRIGSISISADSAYHSILRNPSNQLLERKKVMDLTDPKMTAALIAAAVSIVTVLLGFLFKAWFERYFLIFRLEAEHRYEQKKKIKGVLAKYKTQLLDSGEALNHRLWNFSENHSEGWHTISEQIDVSKNYYLASFVYRLLGFFAWVRKVESEMVHLDTTIASRNDLDFVKYLRLLTQTFCDVELFKGLEYDKSKAKDHFFRNDFVHMCECFWSDSEIVAYSDFKENKNNCLEEAGPVINYINGLNPDEERLRWDRIQAFHYVLLMFLNTYGYDFQYTHQPKVKKLLLRSPRPNKVIKNLKIMLNRMHLDTQKEAKKVLNAL